MQPLASPSPLPSARQFPFRSNPLPVSCSSLAVHLFVHPPRRAPPSQLLIFTSYSTITTSIASTMSLVVGDAIVGATVWTAPPCVDGTI